jgi:hypothetical protein
MTESNPYATPTAPLANHDDRAALCELVRGWEKLRLIYNGIMILPGIGVLALWCAKTAMPVPAAIFLGIVTGINANIAFFLGPLAELYLRGLFRNGESIGKGRRLIFAAGLVVSGGVVMLASIIPLFTKV